MAPQADLQPEPSPAAAQPVAVYLAAERWLRWLIVAVAVLLMVLFCLTALARVRYPYELEQLEGYMFLTALRVFHGQALYPRPSLAFIPYMYPPVYYYVAAALGHGMGMSISTMRVVSSVSTLGCFAAIYALVWRELQRALPALVAAALYASCYTLLDGWFDIGRLDSLFLLLVLLAMLATRWSHPVLAALVWLLAFQTKQSILPAALVMLCFDLHRNRRSVLRTASGVATLLVGAWGSVAWLNHATGGWYRFYCFTVPAANSDLLLRRLVFFWPTDMLRPLAVPLLVIVAALLLTRPALASRATRFYLAAGALVPLYWFVRIHDGSSANALMPVYMLVAVLFGLALGRLLQWLRADCSTGAGLWPQQAICLLLLSTLLQLTARIYNPHDYIPPPQDRRSMDQLMAALRSIPGEVYVGQHPYYAWLVGKPVQADMVALHDAMRPASLPPHVYLPEELRAAFAEHRFQAVLLDMQVSEPLLDSLVSTVPPSDAAAGAAGIRQWHSDFQRGEYILPNDVVVRPDWLLLHCAPGEAKTQPLCR